MLQEIEHAVVKVKGGVPITIGQIAEIRLGAALKRGDASLNGGKPLVLGAITKAFGADTLTTTR